MGSRRGIIMADNRDKLAQHLTDSFGVPFSKDDIIDENRAVSKGMPSKKISSKGIYENGIDKNSAPNYSYGGPTEYRDFKREYHTIPIRSTTNEEKKIIKENSNYMPNGGNYMPKNGGNDESNKILTGQPNVQKPEKGAQYTITLDVDPKPKTKGKNISAINNTGGNNTGGNNIGSDEDNVDSEPKTLDDFKKIGKNYLKSKKNQKGIDSSKMVDAVFGNNSSARDRFRNRGGVTRDTSKTQSAFPLNNNQSTELEDIIASDKNPKKPNAFSKDDVESLKDMSEEDIGKEYQNYDYGKRKKNIERRTNTLRNSQGSTNDKNKAAENGTTADNSPKKKPTLYEKIMNFDDVTEKALDILSEYDGDEEDEDLDLDDQKDILEDALKEIQDAYPNGSLAENLLLKEIKRIDNIFLKNAKYDKKANKYWKEKVSDYLNYVNSISKEKADNRTIDEIPLGDEKVMDYIIENDDTNQSFEDSDGKKRQINNADKQVMHKALAYSRIGNTDYSYLPLNSKLEYIKDFKKYGDEDDADKAFACFVKDATWAGFYNAGRRGIGESIQIAIGELWRYIKEGKNTDPRAFYSSMMNSVYNEVRKAKKHNSVLGMTYEPTFNIAAINKLEEAELKYDGKDKKDKKTGDERIFEILKDAGLLTKNQIVNHNVESAVKRYKNLKRKEKEMQNLTSSSFEHNLGSEDDPVTLGDYVKDEENIRLGSDSFLNSNENAKILNNIEEQFQRRDFKDKIIEGRDYSYEDIVNDYKDISETKGEEEAYKSLGEWYGINLDVAIAMNKALENKDPSEIQKDLTRSREKLSLDAVDRLPNKPFLPLRDIMLDYFGVGGHSMLKPAEIAAKYFKKTRQDLQISPTKSLPFKNIKAENILDLVLYACNELSKDPSALRAKKLHF